MLSSSSYNATMGPSAGLAMRRHYLPFRPNAALVVLLLILAAFAWAGSDETRLEQSCNRWVQNAAACRRF